MRTLALLLAPVLGCTGVHVGFEPATGATTHAARAAADVQVYEASGDEAVLPTGVWLDPKDFEAPLRVDPPNELLGTVTYDRCYLQDALAAARAEAARRGANALIDMGGCKGRAWAVALSDAAAAPDAAALLAEQEAAQPDYVVVAEETRSLAGFEPIAIEASRGRCYAVGYALAADGALSNGARKRLTGRVGGAILDEDDLPDTGSLTWDDRSMSVHFEATGKTRVGFERAVCVSATRQLSISLRRADTDDAADAVLGKGSMVVRVYARDIDEAELVRLITERRDRQRAAAEEKAALQAQGCLICRQHRDECFHENQCDAYRSCLDAYEARPADCPE